MDKSKLVSIAIFRYSHRAHLLKALLEDAGIDSQVISSSIFRQIDTAKLIVHIDDVEKARVILSKNKDKFENDEIESL